MDSFTLKFIIAGVCIMTLGISGIYFGLQKPMEDQINKSNEEDKLKTTNEINALHGMDCKQLGDWLLTDKWYNHDNLIWAQNHYLVECK